MNETMQRYLDSLIKNIESRSQSERILILGMLLGGLGMFYLTLLFDPVRVDIGNLRAQVRVVENQILSQQTNYAAMLATSQEDPNKFANDRLVVISREQATLDQEINALAGDLVTPSQMTQILTTVLENQAGLELVSFENRQARPLRENVVAARDALAQQEDNVSGLAEIVGQVYEHGLLIEFEGDFFSTLKYLRFLEEIGSSFFWDTIRYRQEDWPGARVSLEIHTLSMDRGFIGA